MLVLALDTSSAATSAVLIEADKSIRVLTGNTSLDARAHGERLAPNIAASMKEAGAALADLGAIVVGTGPGPYTGLRVGLVTAAVLSETLGIPAYGVCSLDGMSRPFGHHAHPTLLVAADARRKEVYWAQYHDGARVLGPQVSKPGDVPSAGIGAMTGAGARLYADVLGLPLLDGDHPDPAVLVAFALDRIRAHAPSDTLTPLYLRHPDAVVPAAAKAVTPTAVTPTAVTPTAVTP